MDEGDAPRSKLSFMLQCIAGIATVEDGLKKMISLQASLLKKKVGSLSENLLPTPAPEHKKLSWLEEQLARAGGVRDGLLLALSGLYVLGYIVRAFYAWQNNLGLLPAVDTQYFAAGIVPAIVLAGVSFFVLLTGRLSDRFIRWFLFGNWRVRLLGGIGAEGALIALERGLLQEIASPLVQRHILVLLVLFAVLALGGQGVLLVLYSLITLVKNRYQVPAKSSRRQEALANVLSEAQDFVNTYNVSYVPLVVGCWVLIPFVLYIYPAWPQSLEGAHSRTAQIVLDASQLPSLRLLTAVSAPHEQLDFKVSGNVVLLGPVDVFYASSDALLIKPHLARPFYSPRRDATYEIKTSTIKIIAWQN